MCPCKLFASWIRSIFLGYFRFTLTCIFIITICTIWRFFCSTLAYPSRTLLYIIWNALTIYIGHTYFDRMAGYALWNNHQSVYLLVAILYWIGPAYTDSVHNKMSCRVIYFFIWLFMIPHAGELSILLGKFISTIIIRSGIPISAEDTTIR